MAIPTEVRTAADIAMLPLRRYSDQGLIPMRPVSWGALWAGNVVTGALLFLLSMMGIGLAMTATWKNAVWLLLSIMMACYAGASVATHLAGIRRREESVLHGIITWALTVVEGLVLTMSLLASLRIEGLPVESAGVGTTPNIAQIFMNTRVESSPFLSASIAMIGWSLFGMLLAGFVAAGFGGYTGAPRSTFRRYKD